MMSNGKLVRSSRCACCLVISEYITDSTLKVKLTHTLKIFTVNKNVLVELFTLFVPDCLLFYLKNFTNTPNRM